MGLLLSFGRCGGVYEPLEGHGGYCSTGCRDSARPASPEPRVEHHYHAPSNGQVVKAVRQHLAEVLPAAELDAIVKKCLDDNISTIITRALSGWIASERFERFVADTVAGVILSQAGPWTNGYKIENRMRDLVVKEIQRQLTDGYTVTVTPKEPKK